MEVKKILLIDDEPDIRKVASISLEKLGGYDVIQAESGEEGIRLAQTEEPHLIILDMMMPGMDGFSVFDILQKGPTKDIPVVFMTARVQSKELQDYLDRGVAGVIAKPFDPMNLSANVAEIVAKL